MNAWSSFSWTSENFVTGLFFHGSKISNLNSTGSFGCGAPGDIVRSRWNSRGSGMPATSAIPQRGHVPGWSDRMSGSIGQTYARSRDGSGPADVRGDDCVLDVPAGADDAPWQAASDAASTTISRSWRRIAAYCTALASVALAIPELSAHDPS